MWVQFILLVTLGWDIGLFFQKEKCHLLNHQNKTLQHLERFLWERSFPITDQTKPCSACEHNWDHSWQWYVTKYSRNVCVGVWVLFFLNMWSWISNVNGKPVNCTECLEIFTFKITFAPKISGETSCASSASL